MPGGKASRNSVKNRAHGIGGPFRNRRDLQGVTPKEALAHPTWSMGPKITIDSATMMNKGLEAIEAHHLFDFSFDRIGIVVHPQSVVHGIIELIDGTALLQAAPTDMRIPIQAALTWPERSQAPFESTDFTKMGELNFEPLDQDRFPCVELAYEAGRRGGSAPAALNAANEIAVGAFLDGSIRFTDIAEVVGTVLEGHEITEADELDEVLEQDERARTAARRVIESMVSAR